EPAPRAPGEHEHHRHPDRHREDREPAAAEEVEDATDRLADGPAPAEHLGHPALVEAERLAHPDEGAEADREREGHHPREHEGAARGGGILHPPTLYVPLARAASSAPVRPPSTRSAAVRG